MTGPQTTPAACHRPSITLGQIFLSFLFPSHAPRPVSSTATLDDSHIISASAHMAHNLTSSQNSDEDLGGKPVGHVLTETIIEKATLESGDWTKDEESALIRKIDRRLVPFLVITYALTYYDKTVQAQAAIYGFLKDEHLTGDQYRNVSLIFYLGYIIGSYPCSFVAQRYHVGRACAIMCLLWGLTVLCTIFCKGYVGLMIQRTALGFIESGIAPTFMAMTGSWYRRDEQVLRIAFFYASTPFTQLWGPPINLGFGEITNAPLQGWKYMFIFAGCFTLAWGIVVYMFFPTDPTRSVWLTARERDLAIARLRSNNAGLVNHHIKLYQLWETVTDLNFWGICIIGFAITMTNGTTSSFASIVIKSFGFTNVQSLLLQMPWGILAGCNMIAGAWLSGRYKNIRFYVYMAGCVPVIAGSALLWKAPDHKGPKLLGYYLLTTFGMAYAQVMAMCVSNVSGYTKRVATGAGLFISYSIANIVALLAFQKNQAPQYQNGFIAVLISVAVGFVVAGLQRTLLRQRNVARDVSGTVEFTHALEDLTDFENRSFRYVL